MSTLFAYIDPFTTTILIQLIAGAFLSVMIFLKKIKAFVLGLFGIKKDIKTDAESQEVQSVNFPEASTEDKKVA